ncbi:dimethylaniline monooxygenase [N-oxide-forming] 2-like [Argopecten irradians]|uniref:dimethylaniline monooxygenase [N-oxide-forming] 2-like n=1 Tax=Argopecten irradians TaxID=31199 RepID=UPI00371D3CA8
MTKTVLVVGAGVSGLAAVKHCLDEGMEPICFEKDTDVGGLWNYHDWSKEGDPSLYNSCSINTSKEMTCYSDFPIPKEFPNFMGHRHFKKYLELYAEHFNLRKYIKFSHSVENIKKADDFDETGNWMTLVKNLETGKFQNLKTNFVIVCNGHLHVPNVPTFPGLKKFKGKVMHTHDYKDFRGFEGKRILVMGIGNSGSDVACELSRHAEHVYMSSRRGTYVIQRAADHGVPFDHLALNRFSMKLPWSLMRPLFFHRLNRRYNHANYGLSPNKRFDASVLTISDDLPNRILLGTINIKCNVKEFTVDGAIFEDGTELKDIDVVILATGFNFDFPFLDDGIIKIDGHFPYLYELVFPTNLNPCTLGVVGLVQPFGALPPILEMQTRCITRVFAGKCKLPSAPQRLEIVEKRKSFIMSNFIDSPRYSLQIYSVQYMDRLASMIGCKPNFWKYFFTDPKLWYRIVFGPATPVQWRLNGPGAWKGAKRAIETVKEHTYFPMKSRRSGDGEMDGLYDGWIQLFRKVCFVASIPLIVRYLYVNGFFKSLINFF